MHIPDMVYEVGLKSTVVCTPFPPDIAFELLKNEVLVNIVTGLTQPSMLFPDENLITLNIDQIEIMIQAAQQSDHPDFLNWRNYWIEAAKFVLMQRTSN